MPRIEYRTALELRSDGRTLYGLAAPYNQPATIGSFTERIARGAFARVLRDKSDVLLCRDHNTNQLLARCSNSSLVLEDASDGLHFRAQLAEFTLADDTLAQVRAGLLAGMSIGFYTRAETWNGARDQRTLNDLELVEISAVGPAVAYGGTSIAARSRGHLYISAARARLLRGLEGL
jgi:HK97 family phage prohead protease